MAQLRCIPAADHVAKSLFYHGLLSLWGCGHGNIFVHVPTGRLAPVGLGQCLTGQRAIRPLGVVGLMVAPDLVELLAAIPRDLAGPGDVAYLRGELLGVST